MIETFYILAVAVLVAMLAGWLILLLGKTGLREWGQVHAPKLVAKMLECDFCLSWWTCLAIILLWVIATGDVRLVLGAFAATPIARYIIY
jgi:flagellar biosynthesis protein FliQ